MGASGGLGLEMIESLFEGGYKLALHYNSSYEGLEKKLAKMSSSFCKLYQADITKETDIQALIKDVHNDFGRIDVLVNAAGITASGMSWKMDASDWDKTMAVNLTGPFLTIKHSLPYMREAGFGRIINISSIVAQTGVIGTSAYAASKAGLIGLVKTISKETANKNITINNVALGYFGAGMIHEVPEAIQEEIKEQIPKKAFGNPEELANCILYLCGDKASYITGQTINLNGGLYA